MKLTKDKVKKAGVRAGAALGAAGATQALLSKSPINRKSLVGLGATALAASGATAIAKKLQNKKKKGSFSNNELTEFKDFTVNASFPAIEIKETKPKTAVELAYEKIKNRDKLPDHSSSLTANI